MRWDVTQGLFRVYETGGGSAPSSTTSTTQNFSPEEAAQRAKVQDEANRIYGQTADSLTAAGYPGSKPVPFSDATTQAQGMLGNFATGQGTQQAQQAGGFSSFLMGPAADANSNPYLQSAMQAAIRPVTQAYTDPGGVMSQIRTGAQQAGQYGGSRQGVAEGVATRGYLNTVGDVTSKMAEDNYNTSMQRGTQALALAPQTYTLGTQPASSLAAVGQQQELLGQSQEDYNAAARNWQLNAPWLPLQNYANIVYGGSSPGTSSTSTGSVASSNRFGSILGGAASGAALGSMVMPGMGTLIGGGLGLLSGLL